MITDVFKNVFSLKKTNLNGKLEKAKKNELIEMLSFVLLKVCRASHTVCRYIFTTLL